VKKNKQNMKNLSIDQIIKNRKIAIRTGAALIVAIVAFFILYSGNRGVGTYTSSYATFYDKPGTDEMKWVAEARPEEEIRVTHVSTSGWATVDYPGHGKVYTNFFDLTPKEVRYPVRATDFYDGSEALLFPLQVLLWIIFCTAGVILLALSKGKETVLKTASLILVSLEIAYAIISIIYRIPPEILAGVAFEGPLQAIPAFLANTVGLAILGWAHVKLIKLARAAVKESDLPAREKIIARAIILFVVLFTIYVALMLVLMSLVVVVACAVIAGVLALFSVMTRRTHVTLTKDPSSGKWKNGNDEYDVNEARGTAKKKRFFDL
jgi:hypothetical protein